MATLVITEGTMNSIRESHLDMCAAYSMDENTGDKLFSIAMRVYRAGQCENWQAIKAEVHQSGLAFNRTNAEYINQLFVVIGRKTTDAQFSAFGSK